MKPLLKVLKTLKIVTVWKDGSTVSFTWNYWNPLSWPIILALVLPAILMGGLRDFLDYPHNYGFGLSKYWKDHKNDRQFL